MLQFTSLILLIVQFLLPVEVRAEGVGSSGGGIGVSCPNGLATLDLYEAKYVHGLTLSSPAKSLEENIIASYRKFATYFTTDPVESDASIWDEAKKFLTLFQDVPTGSLKQSQDATLPALPAGCRFVQIALFDDVKNRIYLDRSLWDQLDAQNQASLVLHEGIYKMARDNRARTSDDTRRVVGEVFSTQSMPNIWKDTEGKNGIICTAGFGDGNHSESAYFIFFIDEVLNGKAGVKAYFSLINSYLMLSETSTFIEGQTIAGILKNGFAPTRGVAYQALISRNWNFEILPQQVENPFGDFISAQFRADVGALAGKPFSNASCQLAHTGSLK